MVKGCSVGGLLYVGHSMVLYGNGPATCCFVFTLSEGGYVGGVLLYVGHSIVLYGNGPATCLLLQPIFWKK